MFGAKEPFLAGRRSSRKLECLGESPRSNQHARQKTALPICLRMIAPKARDRSFQQVFTRQDRHHQLVLTAQRALQYFLGDNTHVDQVVADPAAISLLAGQGVIHVPGGREFLRDQ
jgi:hypothetical protein